MSDTTDREMLELAAKAAGISVKRSRLDDPVHSDFLIANSPRNADQTYGAWNPLIDDGDALRLAVKLKLDVNHNQDYACVYSWNIAIEIERGLDEVAATRRAITRAAAEIGKAMP